MIDIHKKVERKYTLEVPCFECGSPNQFPQGVFNTIQCSECLTSFLSNNDGIKEVAKIKVVDTPLATMKQAGKKIKKVGSTKRLSGMSLYSEDEQAKFKTQVMDNKLRCSFCGNSVERVHATNGVSQPKKYTKTIYYGSSQEYFMTHFDQQTMHSVDKVIACPDCIDNIQPILNKNKDIISQGIKFPETEG